MSFLPISSCTRAAELLAPFAFCGMSVAALGCPNLKDITTAKMPWEHPSIAEVAPKGPTVPLVAPKETLKGEKGSASANYPATFVVTIKSDGTILFPDSSPGKLKGASIILGGSPVATLSPDGEVTGSGLKRKYKFAADGDLLDPEGRGLRVSPAGGVRGIGGPWHYKDVMVWGEPGKTGTDKSKMGSSEGQASAWDRAAWRTVAIVSLLMVENLLPEAIGR